MPSTFGTTLKVSIFGQSHSCAIGCVIEGLPAGFALDKNRLASFMQRRAPGNNPWSTPRKEADEVEILSGLNSFGKTCGAPFALMIKNTNVRSQDYSDISYIPRPGHADYAAELKWQGNQDVNGGGHFSGRLTAPLVAAGAIAIQILEEKDVRIAAHLLEVAGIKDEGFAVQKRCDAERLALQMASLQDGRSFSVIDKHAGEKMQKAIGDAQKKRDSVGGIIECVATGVPGGIGSPIFDGLESTIARAVFGIPAVKGLEFGSGFESARLLGSQNNDPYEIEDGSVVTTTNNAGGNLGGISNGAPLYFRMAIKPTPSISAAQESVDLHTHTNTTLCLKGRHDPCIAPRAVPVAEAVMALSILDSWLSWPQSSHPF